MFSACGRALAGLVVAASVIGGCGANAGTRPATSRPTGTVTVSAAPAPRASHGYRLTSRAFVIREPGNDRLVSYQVRFRLNRRPPVDPAGGAKLHVNLAGEGPETAPSRVGLRTRWCYASDLANDYAKIPGNATRLDLSIRVGAIGDHTMLTELGLPVVFGRKAFYSAYRRLGCLA